MSKVLAREMGISVQEIALLSILISTEFRKVKVFDLLVKENKGIYRENGRLGLG